MENNEKEEKKTTTKKTVKKEVNTSSTTNTTRKKTDSASKPKTTKKATSVTKEKTSTKINNTTKPKTTKKTTDSKPSTKKTTKKEENSTIPDIKKPIIITSEPKATTQETIIEEKKDTPNIEAPKIKETIIMTPEIKSSNKKSGFIWILLLLILIAGSIFFYYSKYRMVEVPILAQDIEQGTKITEEMIQTSKLRVSEVDTNIFLSKEDVIGKYVPNGMSLSKDQYILKTQLSSTKPEELISVPMIRKDMQQWDYLKSDSVTYKKIPKNEVSKEATIDISTLFGKYVKEGTTLKAGSYLNANDFVDIDKSNFQPKEPFTYSYSLLVNGLADNIYRVYPHQKIKIYFRATIGKKTIYSLLSEEVWVGSITDSGGNSIFKEAERRSPSYIQLYSDAETIDLIRTAALLRGYTSSIVLSPINENYVCPYGEKVSFEEIKQFIMEH